MRSEEKKKGAEFEKTVILQALRHALAFIFEKFSPSSLFTGGGTFNLCVKVSNLRYVLKVSHNHSFRCDTFPDRS